ncbi:hypothetical protein MNB_SM-6-984 [hydrothermal vent metagenome]|uniref:DUF4393 domain-containing protein n=1 Tax=hydrothermal vent metagenome TaxID=652676 RepID=A0A1W1CEF4_9ZZZZ
MAIDDEMKTVKEGVAVVGEIIKAAGDNPNVKEAGSNLGQTALTITKTINNALLPLAAINFSFDKARAYFSEKFEKDLSEKADKIPFEDIVEPKASIAGPTLQGLAFTHEEENLKDMYLSLLATAMNGKTSEEAHPAFVEIIKQLTSEEAHLLKSVLSSNGPIAISEIRLKEDGEQGWKTLLKHLIDVSNSKTGEAVENNRYPSMIENWIRLGLIEVNYTQHIADKTAYDWNKTRPEVNKLRIQYETESSKIIFQNGILERTALGEHFAKAVDI